MIILAMVRENLIKNEYQWGVDIIFVLTETECRIAEMCRRSMSCIA